MSIETGSADTHPAHRDRIAALGVDVRTLVDNGGSPAAPIAITAADHFLGPLFTWAAVRKLDRTPSSWRARGKTPSRALCAALLRSLISQQPAVPQP